MLKVKEYSDFDSYEMDQRDSEGNSIEIDNLISIVPTMNGQRKCADAIITCGKPQTAMKRFFESLDSFTNYFGNWKDDITESIKNGVWKFNEPDVGHWTVENLSENLWYIELTSMNQAE